MLAYLRRTPSIEVVVLAGNFARFAQDGTQALRPDGRIAPASQADLIEAQRRTALLLRMMGKRVVIVTGPVAARFDVGQCWARQQGHLISMPPAPGCAIPAEARAVPQAWSDALFAGFAGKGATPVVRLDTLLCPDPRQCATMLGGVPLYRDTHHLGAAGSALVGQQFGLSERLREAAR